MEDDARLQSELKSVQASWERRVGEAQIVALYQRGGIELPTRNGEAHNPESPK